uniref:Rhodanese domain-containing protein n=1 Tax=Leersia perrieri TaxID=77586 RepID=A0A0D9W1P5_9ORYZ
MAATVARLQLHLRVFPATPPSLQLQGPLSKFRLPPPPTRIRCSSSSPTTVAYQTLRRDDFLVVTFYKFVPLHDPRAEVATHLHFLQGRDIHGRIYINEQGINAQLEGGCSHLPLVDPSMRATPLTPSEWRERLENRKTLDVSSSGTADLSSSETAGDSSGRKLLLLDVRNDYEWDIGHFQGAQRPNVDCFRSTSFGLPESEQEMDSSDPLNGIDKENTDILMYCTGGIRCDVYSTILRKKGFRNLYTLKGGVSNYLKNEGSAGWVGNLFVFDGRLSLPPATYKPGADDDDQLRNRSSSELGRCYPCGSEVVELRHRNCANIDCNRLYLRCVEELRGCCCKSCTAAPRLRPLLPTHQRYEKWHLYRHLDLGAPSSSS